LDDFSDERALKKKGITPQKANALRDERINNILKIFNRFGAVEKRRVFSTNKKTSIFITYKDPKVAVNVVSVLKDAAKRKELVKPSVSKTGKPSPNDITSENPLALPHHTFYVRLVRNRENAQKNIGNEKIQSGVNKSESIEEGENDVNEEEEEGGDDSIENDNDEENSETDLDEVENKGGTLEGEEEEEKDERFEKQVKLITPSLPHSILVKGKEEQLELDSDFQPVKRGASRNLVRWDQKIERSDGDTIATALKKIFEFLDHEQQPNGDSSFKRERKEKGKGKEGKEKKEAEEGQQRDNMFFALTPQKKSKDPFFDQSDDISKYQVQAPSHLLQTFYEAASDHDSDSDSDDDDHNDQNEQKKKKKVKEKKEIDPVQQVKTIKMLNFLLSSWENLLEENIIGSYEPEIRDLLDLQRDNLTKGLIQSIHIRMKRLLEKQNALRFAKIQKNFSSKPKYPTICDGNMFEELRETAIKM